MDLGINGRWALVCGASKGLGKGCATALVREGVNVVVTARGAEALEATVTELRALNPAVSVVSVAGDITTPEGRLPALAACPQVDILVNNAGGPPPGDFRDRDRSKHAGWRWPRSGSGATRGPCRCRSRTRRRGGPYLGGIVWRRAPLRCAA